MTGAEKMRKWRSNPANVKRQDERRKVLRDTNSNGYREKYNAYYAANKERIIERTMEYRKAHPEMVEKIKNKNRITGRDKIRGRRDRANLKDHYIKSLIDSEGSNKPIIEKKREVMQYRIKKVIKKIA